MSPVLDPAPTPPAHLLYARKLWFWLGSGLFTLLLILLAAVAGVIFLIFYIIAHSQPAQMTVALAKENPATLDALGEIQETGWPMGSFSTEAGGSGKASFSTSLTGTKANGKLFTTLKRINGEWSVVSGRLQLEDGHSIKLQLGHPNPGRERPRGSEDAPSGGTQLRSDRGDLEWRHVDWPGKPISFDVPADWVERHSEEGEKMHYLDYRPANFKAYFIGYLTYFNQKMAFDSILDSMVHQYAAQHKRGEVTGYRRHDLGRAHGVFWMSSRSDGQTTAIWTGFFDDPELGTVSVSFVMGAPSKADFEKFEPTLGAILESIEVK